MGKGRTSAANTYADTYSGVDPCRWAFGVEERYIQEVSGCVLLA